MLKSAVFLFSVGVLMPWAMPVHVPAIFLLSGVALFENRPLRLKILLLSLLVVYAIILYRIYNS
ncbi:MAG: hypothetical protein QF560_15030 [SAR324 cluster bacterium]|jgi:hypothetical protein|nr:hypothetical protein [SAR324 cluster bacterium]